MPRAQDHKNEALTREDRRQRRLLRRERQRQDNIGRAAKMHAARLQMERAGQGQSVPALKASAYVGCSGWFTGSGGAHFIQMTCRQVSGFVATSATFARLKSTHPFILGRPWQT
jgi:hypothetical protein